MPMMHRDKVPVDCSTLMQLWTSPRDILTKDRIYSLLKLIIMATRVQLTHWSCVPLQSRVTKMEFLRLNHVRNAIICMTIDALRLFCNIIQCIILPLFLGLTFKRSGTSIEKVAELTNQK